MKSTAPIWAKPAGFGIVRVYSSALLGTITSKGRFWHGSVQRGNGQVVLEKESGAMEFLPATQQCIGGFQAVVIHVKWVPRKGWLRWLIPWKKETAKEVVSGPPHVTKAAALITATQKAWEAKNCSFPHLLWPASQK